MSQASVLLLVAIGVVSIFALGDLNVVMRDRPPLIKDPLPYTYIDATNLPDYWDIRNISGINMATPIRSQMVPLYCGSCWTFATTSTLSDRLKLMRKAAFPDYQLAPQVLLNCALGMPVPVISAHFVEHGNLGCNGGDAYYAMDYIYKYASFREFYRRIRHNISDETCAPYQAAGFACVKQGRCTFCDDGGYGCNPIPDGKYQTFTVSEYGKIPASGTNHSTMVEQMMTEIFARGPIACLIEADDDFDHHYHGGIMTPRKFKGTNHVISVSGWGSEVVNGTNLPYWIVRNSYGSWWGSAFSAVLTASASNLLAHGVYLW